MVANHNTVQSVMGKRPLIVHPDWPIPEMPARLTERELEDLPWGTTFIAVAGEDEETRREMGEVRLIVVPVIDSSNPDPFIDQYGTRLRLTDIDVASIRDVAGPPPVRPLAGFS
ncbi:hypothetical protein [Curtobacterium sp. MCPF17_031]|uniref:hypothetical protein n=1 Tax=Curtobacterium sp. MCPF17_031 TaxID=2175653 RepID=UPI000DAA1598|nr:hypothetical protein [Curtobacterium sp. MCPF17_031]PZE33933.1 hypothetical protein DEJ31_15955 [Curtobacterium sp. MCPF17_031]